MVTLLVDSNKSEIAMDRFGGATEWFLYDVQTVKAVAKIYKSELFLGCIAGLDGTACIAELTSLKNEVLYIC